MEISPVGAAGAIAQLATGIGAQQQVAASSAVAQPGGAPGTLQQTTIAKPARPERANAAPGQDQTAEAIRPATQQTSDRAERLEPLAERQLFDYLVDVEKGLAGAGAFSSPSALVGSAMHSLEGALQQAQQAFNGARAQSASASAADGEQTPTGQIAQTGVQSLEATPGNSPAVDMSATLERSISFMWAAANVGLVVNSVTAATASANTLIKQQ